MVERIKDRFFEGGFRRCYAEPPRLMIQLLSLHTSVYISLSLPRPSDMKQNRRHPKTH